MTDRLHRPFAAFILLLVAVVGALSSACSSCRREPAIADAAYREVVAAFYTGVAAMETTQEVLAREKFDRVIALAPSEPAAYANLGLLLLRQQEIEQATQTLTKAAALAPDSAEIQTLLALAASRAGALDAAVGHWRRALELRPEDRRAAFALARDLERQGGAEQEAQAQRALAALVARRDNLAARLDLARLAAKRGDAEALRQAIAPLAQASASWLPQAQAQLQAVRDDVASNPRAAATRIAFIKNFLVRDPDYRRAMAELTTPLDAVGVPLDRFLVLKNPEPAAAAPDTTLAFDPPRAVAAEEDRAGSAAGKAADGDGAGTVTWAGAISLTGDGAPVLVTATDRDVRIVRRDKSAAALNQGTQTSTPTPATPARTPATPPASARTASSSLPGRTPDGVLAADLTYDFRTDLVLAGAGGLSLMSQEASGQFVDVTAKSGLPAALLTAPAYGAWAADVDTDGDLDLVTAPASGAPAVLRNNGDGTFAALTPFPGADAVRSFAWADFDGEGVPDAALLQADGAIRLFVSLRGGTFREQTLPAGVPKAAAIAAAEVTGDALFDLLVVAGDGTIVRVSRDPVSPSSHPSWTMATVAPATALASTSALVSAPAGTAGAKPPLTPGVTRLLVADLDNNAAADLIVSTAAAPDTRTGTASNPASSPSASAAAASSATSGTSAASGTSATGAAKPPSPAAPATAAFAAAASPTTAPFSTRVLLGGPVGTFTPLASSPDLRVLAAADLDEDGRLDLIGLRDGAAMVVRSRGTKVYHWQRLRPRAATATGDQRINSFGIGGEVEVRAGLHVQKQPIAAPLVYVGLGEATQADVIRIIWPNGVLQSEFDKRADATIATDQRLKGSCPWLFAWNGREMAFVTDLIWRSPLGLRINAQTTADVAMTEDWVKVRGDQLVPRDGAYDLRITADLWETHFFDLVSLLVVDHPPGTEVFVDERFAVPAPALDVKVTGPVRPFAAVRALIGADAPAGGTNGGTAASRDAGGRADQGRARDGMMLDVADVVFARDDRHLDIAGRGRYQGVTRDHAIEMTLPDEAPRDGPLWLVGQGWVHPTDSSINVALGQGAHAAPRGLSLAVADADGRFREVRAGLGFPAGKDKTVLIDLTGLFPSRGERRVRLSTNLEIFWDRLGWAQGRPDVVVAPRRIEASHAELRYRGFSRTDQKDASTPERPRYQIAGTAPRWRDLEGWYTRFGDVRPLVARVDDRYAIMNAGDELALRFPEAPPPAPGQLRDFVVIGDGWVKDGDYNTAFSRTVLPLPTHADPRYDRPPGRLEDDPVFRTHPQDFEVYHTRYASPDAARDALRPRRQTR